MKRDFDLLIFCFGSQGTPRTRTRTRTSRKTKRLQNTPMTLASLTLSGSHSGPSCSRAATSPQGRTPEWCAMLCHVKLHCAKPVRTVQQETMIIWHVPYFTGICLERGNCGDQKQIVSFCQKLAEPRSCFCNLFPIVFLLVIEKHSRLLDIHCFRLCEPINPSVVTV